MKTAPTRRRFCWSLRTMFVVVTVFSVFMGWLIAQQKWSRDRHEAIDWIQSQRRWNLASTRNHGRLPWGLRLVGERFCMDFFQIDEKDLKDEDKHRIEQLRRLFPEAHVEVSDP